MLDVGCGAGDLLLAMQKLGWDVHGVDLSPLAVGAASKRVGPSRATVGTLETLDHSVNEFDLVTMIHSLEHVPNPRATLQEAHRRLAVNGVLKVAVPDVSGFEARLFGRYWLGLDVPRHLCDFSMRTLAKLLHESGFTVESWRPQYFPWLFCNSFNAFLKLGWNVRSPLIHRILAGPVFAMAILS
jgi:2-polyprenyl-3-methyl-5-hydroxy-6-metoxy-1,4-benzoquinol methylase